MENKNRKELKTTKRIFMIFFIMFLCLYSVSMNGYSRTSYHKTLYTEEQIKEFEQDVKSGKEIDINKYIKYDNIDYSNKYSSLGEKVSNAIGYVANKSISAIISFFSFFFK